MSADLVEEIQTGHEKVVKEMISWSWLGALEVKMAAV